MTYLIPALNAMDTPEERLDFLNQQLRIIAVSASQAKARGDTDGLRRLLDLYNRARADAATLRGTVSQAERPSDFLLALDRFSDAALAVGADAFGIVAAAGKALPFLLLAAIAVVGIGFYKGSLSVRR